MLKMKNENDQHNDLQVENADGEWVVVAYGESIEVADEQVEARAAQGFTATPQSIGAAVKRAEKARARAEKEREKAAAGEVEEQEAEGAEPDASADTSAEGEQA